jgi:predicted ATPase/class 3 adenylate cyclase
MNCGSALSNTCANCGSDLPDGAAFCPACAHPVGRPAPAPISPPAPESTADPETTDDRVRRFMPADLAAKLQDAASRGEMKGERRTVTMLFCDIKGSTTAAETLDPEEWADIMNGAFEHLIAPVYRYEGTLARLLGDAVLAFFGAPITHEDDPERAVRAGLEIIEGIEPYKEKVRRDWGIDIDVRVGINTGLVVVGAVGSDLRVEYTVMGDAVNVAARMEQAAVPGTVQISGPTYEFVSDLFDFEDLGVLEVKGRTEPVAAYRAVRPRGRLGTQRGVDGLRSDLIGRDAELAGLRDAFDQVAAGHGSIVSVTGEAGLGKTRLVSELRSQLDSDGILANTGWHQGRSLSFETATLYAPVQEILRSLLDLSSDENDFAAVETAVGRLLPGRIHEVAPFVADLVGFDLPEAHAHRVGYLDPGRLRAETFKAVLAVVEAAASLQPLVIVFEDLHWADSASIDLAIDLMGLTDRANLLLVFLFRQHRQEISWKVHEKAERDYPHRYRVVSLSPLPTNNSRKLVSSLLNVDGLTDTVRDLILDKSDGNPFYIEEVIRSMIDDGLVVHEDGRWVAPRPVASFPVPATLSAVLTSRLDRLEEGVRTVAQAASIVGREFQFDQLSALITDPARIDQALIELQRREIVGEISRVPKRVFQFKHALVADAVYETILLKSRRQWHASLADFLERLHPEHVEDIADHLLRSRQQTRAVPYLVAAAERAAGMYAVAEAITRAEQALEILGNEGEADLLRRSLEVLGKAREFSFDLQGAAETYDRLLTIGEARQDTAMHVSGLNKKALLKGFFFDQRQEALEDLAVAERLAKADDQGESLIESSMNQCFLRTAHAEFDEVVSYMDQITQLGERLDHDDATLFGMAHLANSLMLMTRFDEALESAEKALASAEQNGNLKYQAELLTGVVPTCHMRNGDFGEALEAIERGMEIALQIGARDSEVLAAVMQGQLAMRQGALEDALGLFRRAMAAADAIGIPALQALGLCVTGTCYQQIGGNMLETALEFHDRTLNAMTKPTGLNYGAQLWAEIGLCAMAAGRVDDAKELFEKALTVPTAPTHLMRPSVLRGLTLVALAEGRVDDARATYEEMVDYVQERQMQDHYVFLPLTGAAIEAAAENHEGALQLLDDAAAIAVEHDMNRLLLDVKGAQAASLDALGRTDEATTARETGRRVTEHIAGSIRDEEIRREFLNGAAETLGTARDGR